MENAPILEAIVSLQCDSSAEIDLPAIETLAKNHFHDAYPRLEQLVQAEATFTLPPEGEPDSKIHHQVNGFRLLDKSPPSEVLHFTPQAFSFNKLRPYSNFDELQKNIANGWRFYIEHFRPEVVQRIGLRYVNRIELPLKNQHLELADYFKTMPKLPASEAQQFVGFFQTLRFECTETGYLTQVALATQEPKDGLYPVVMDVESFAQTTQKPQSFDAYSDIIEKLRHLKNLHFYDNLTKACLELFH